MSEIKEIPTEINEQEEITETPPEPTPPEDVPPPALPLKRAKTLQEEEPEEEIPEPEEEIPEPKKKAKKKVAPKPKGRPKGSLGKVKQVTVSKEPHEVRTIPAAAPPQEEEDLSVMLFKMIRQQDELTRERKRRLYASWFE